MLRILVVDDERDARDDMVACVDWASHGMEVVGCADDGMSALALIRTAQPDVVLIDIQMPGLSGLDVIHTVQEEGHFVPAFIIISGYDDFTYAQQAIHLDVDEYLLKPFRPQDIIAAVQKSVARLSAVRELHGGAVFPFYLTCFNADELEGPSVYPTEEERRLRAAILTGGSQDIDTAAAAFFAAVQTANQNLGPELNSTLMLYADICRLLAERGSALRSNHFSGLSWTEQTAHASMQAAISSAAHEAHVILGNNSQSRKVVNRAAAYIAEHYAEDLSLELVAQRLYVTAPYLSGLFSKHLGMGFVEFIHATRIDHAKQLLAGTDLQAQEIAQAVGYPDTKYFSSLFKKHTGFTPTAFRGQSQGGEAEG